MTLKETLHELGWSSPQLATTASSTVLILRRIWVMLFQPRTGDIHRGRPPISAMFFPIHHTRQPHDVDYPRRRREEVCTNAITFLNRQVRHLWPKAVRRSGEFRWELLVASRLDIKKKRNKTTRRETNEQFTKQSYFRTQFWTANVNPSDRYVLALPGSADYRISPLDDTYDNLTIAGDWTECGLNVGCVEAAVMSGRLAAHAITRLPALEDIVGYDHP